MHKYEIDVSVDRKRTKIVVNANNSIDARKLVEAQYKNCKLIFWQIKDLGRI